MVRKINKIETDLNNLHEVITKFINEIPDCYKFSEINFPEWFIEDFKSTKLLKKLNEVFIQFKSFENHTIEKGLVSIFNMNNEVFKICSRGVCASYIEKNELSEYYAQFNESFVNKFSELFDSLYSNYLNRKEFNSRINTNIRKYIRKFNKENGRICVFCGLDHNMVIDGQARPALDHWLPKSKFPFSAINFDNLVPACEHCNELKDAINFLSDEYSTKNVGYYPYTNLGGVRSVFEFKSPPKSSEALQSNNIVIGLPL